MEPTAKIKGHKGVILKLAWSPNGRYLASTSMDGTIRLWEFGSWQPHHLLECFGDFAFCLAWSNDGKTLAAGHMESSITIRDAKTGELKGTIEAHSDYVHALSRSPDGKTLASASPDMSVCLWDSESLDQQSRYQTHTGYVRDIAWHPSGKNLVSVSEDATARIFDVSSKSDSILYNGESPINCAAYYRSGDNIVIGQDSGILVKLDEGGNVINSIQAHDAPITGLNISLDGRLLASVSKDNTIKIYDTNDFTQLQTLDAPHSGFILTNAVIHPNNQHLAGIAEKGRAILIWDLEGDLD